MNYIKAVREFLENDIDVKAYTTNIKWIRVDNDTPTMPLIIFTELSKNNEYWGQTGSKGVDVFKVMFEFIVKYEDSVVWREMRELLKFKLNWFAGALSADRVWNINHLSDDSLWYDENKDIVIYASTYLFKNKYDYTSKRTEI